jgi:hypothetical protein
MPKSHKLAMLVSIPAAWITGIVYGHIKQTVVSIK